MYICSSCWNESLKWTWQCSFCKEWNTLKEFKEAKIKSNNKVEVKKLEKISNNTSFEERFTTKSQELNSLLWGGIVTGSAILLSWEPWIWKSTLSLQLSDWVDKNIIYVSWEENSNQISQRYKRLWITWEKTSLLIESNLENIISTLEGNNTDLIIIDSISVITSWNWNWTAWSISQVRTCAETLVSFAKKTNTAMIIIWHVNKDWNLAWPKTLEHLVDTVLYLEWEKYDDLRILRSLKNRFWSTWEIAIFKMLETGLIDLPNPSKEFITSNNSSIWTSISVTLEWNRALIVEIESLTTYTKFGYPKRSPRWINSTKLDLIVAVLWKYSQVKLESYDVYVNIVRWLNIAEPGIDLAIASCIISSKINKPIPKDTIFIWEISLTWEIKSCLKIEKRIKEALKLWFENIIIPDIKSENFWEKNIIKLKNIQELVKFIVEKN